MPEFDIDAVLTVDHSWRHEAYDPWGLCEFFRCHEFQHASISRWKSEQRAGEDVVLLELMVPETAPWQHDTPQEDIDRFADSVEAHVKRLLAEQKVPVRRFELYVGTTDSDIAIYFDVPSDFI